MKRLGRALTPFLHWLFPSIPAHHAALEHMATNIIANFIGLGWAATPPGLQAMQSLQELNPHPKQATRDMCTFMILNMSSLQLIPINMIAYRIQYGSANPQKLLRRLFSPPAFLHLLAFFMRNYAIDTVNLNTNAKAAPSCY